MNANFEWVRIQGKNSISLWQPSVDFSTNTAG
jgi:hypothetical protein